jgi:hypothetical protein
MRNLDFTPPSRSSIGFDHLFDLLNNLSSRKIRVATRLNGRCDLLCGGLIAILPVRNFSQDATLATLL